MNNLSLSLYDIISHFIPGAALLFLLYYFNYFSIKIPTELEVLIFSIVSYISGHLLFAVGNLLFYTQVKPGEYKNKIVRFIAKVIDNLIIFTVRQDYDNSGLDVKDELDSLIKKVYGLEKLNNQARFQLCDALVAIGGYPEREILLAKQGFYRAISALIVVVIPLIFFRLGLSLEMLCWLVLSVISLRLLLYAHTYYGRIRKNQVYFLAFVKLKGENGE